MSVPLIICLCFVAIPILVGAWANRALVWSVFGAACCVVLPIAFVTFALLIQNSGGATPVESFGQAMWFTGDFVAMLATIVVAMIVLVIIWNSPVLRVPRQRAKMERLKLRTRHLPGASFEDQLKGGFGDLDVVPEPELDDYWNQ